ncbi:hypothetical protein ACA910_005120 [Epithemia clementina (nom. ined.)]
MNLNPNYPNCVLSASRAYRSLFTKMRDVQTSSEDFVRSGDCILEAVREIEPACRVGKILIQRDESHPEKLPRLFYSKMPPEISSMHVLLCDPMLATGGSAVMALDVLVRDYGVDPSKIIFANLICAPEGLERLGKEYPAVRIVTACVDKGLNEENFIVPGLGDFGDRFFNTLHKSL